MRPQRVQSAPEVEHRPDAPRPRPIDIDAIAHASPARDLQTSLAESLHDDGEQTTPRWPGAVRLLIIGGGSVLLWSAIIVGVRAVL